MPSLRPFISFPLRANSRDSARAGIARPRASHRPESPFPSWPRGPRPAESVETARRIVEPEHLQAPAADGDAPGLIDHRDHPSTLQLYLNEIGRTALLTADDETRLATRARHGDEAAREQMIKANLRLVVRIARDFNYLGLPLLDLISEGNIGLIKSVERFDPARGNKLSTYAGWWIRQSMKRAVANQSKTIRLPWHQVAHLAQMRGVMNRYLEQFGREPDNEEIASEIGIPVNKVALLKMVSLRPASLDAPLDEDGDARVLGDSVGDDHAWSPREHLAHQSLVADLRSIVRSLDPRAAEILALRYGLDGGEEMTLEEVGRRFRVTRERIRQLQDLALRQVRRKMDERNRQRSRDEIEEAGRIRKRSEILRGFAVQRSAGGGGDWANPWDGGRPDRISFARPGA